MAVFRGTATPKATSPRLLPRRHSRSPAQPTELIPPNALITDTGADHVPGSLEVPTKLPRPATQNVVDEQAIALPTWLTGPFQTGATWKGFVDQIRCRGSPPRGRGQPRDRLRR